jgi:hypothetical protein
MEKDRPQTTQPTFAASLLENPHKQHRIWPNGRRSHTERQNRERGGEWESEKSVGNTHKKQMKEIKEKKR